MFCSFCGNMTTVVAWSAPRRGSMHQRDGEVVLNAADSKYGAMGAAVVTVVTDWGTIQFYSCCATK